MVVLQLYLREPPISVPGSLGGGDAVEELDAEIDGEPLRNRLSRALSPDV
jgi:hypothetical protein